MNQNPFQIIESRFDKLEALLHEVLTSPARPAATESKALATRKQAGEYLGVSQSTIIKLEKSGRLVPVRIGKSVRYDWDHLDSFKETNSK